MHPRELHLKTGAPVIVNSNILHPMLVDGKLFLVVRIDQYTMLVARYDGEDYVVEKEALHLVESKFSFAYIPMILRQFFIQLAFAAKFHKRQGMNLDKLVVCKRSNFVSARQQCKPLSRLCKAPNVLLLHYYRLMTESPYTIHPKPGPLETPVFSKAITFCNPSLFKATYIYDRFWS